MPFGQFLFPLIAHIMVHSLSICHYSLFDRPKNTENIKLLFIKLRLFGKENVWDPMGSVSDIRTVYSLKQYLRGFQVCLRFYSLSTDCFHSLLHILTLKPKSRSNKVLKCSHLGGVEGQMTAVSPAILNANVRRMAAHRFVNNCRVAS